MKKHSKKTYTLKKTKQAKKTNTSKRTQGREFVNKKDVAMMPRTFDLAVLEMINLNAAGIDVATKEGSATQVMLVKK